MRVRSVPALLGLLFTLAGCADPEAASRIEIRRQNAVAALLAARDVYCALPPASRQLLRDAGGIDPQIDSCTPAEIKEITP